MQIKLYVLLWTSGLLAKRLDVIVNLTKPVSACACSTRKTDIIIRLLKMATGFSNTDSCSSSASPSAQPPPRRAPGVPRNRLDGGYDCEFVERPPKAVQCDCPVCLLVLRGPHQVTCCGYSYCATCIKRVQDDEKCCPTCNETDFSVFPDKRLQRSLNDFSVYCVQRGLGCEWEGELGELDRHLSLQPPPEKLLRGCQFSEVECTLCLQPFQLHHLQAHQSDDCPKRPFACQHCKQHEATFEEVAQSHWPVCPSFPLSCPNNCDLVLQRQELEQHVSQECPLTLVDCDFQMVGCEVRLPRRSMPSHINENIVGHMSYVQVHMNTHPGVNMAACVGMVVGTIQKVVIANTHTHSQAKEELQESSDKIAKLQESHDQLKTSFDEKCAEIQHMKQQFITLQPSLEQRKRDLTKTTKTSMELQQSLTELEQKVPDSKVSAETKMSEIGSKTLPFNFTMTEFRSKKENNVEWYSPPFYTHTNGYKMCIRIDSNGSSGGKGTNLSVYAYLTHGPYDDNLLWPFKGTITIQLLNQLKDKNHHTRTINFTNATNPKYVSRVIPHDKAPNGWGKSKFLSHAKLDVNPFSDCQYTKDDQLEFRISSVIFPHSNS